jgi:hypothetical protein
MYLLKHPTDKNLGYSSWKYLMYKGVYSTVISPMIRELIIMVQFLVVAPELFSFEWVGEKFSP